MPFWNVLSHCLAIKPQLINHLEVRHCVLQTMLYSGRSHPFPMLLIKDCLFAESYILVTSFVISGWASPSDSTHSWCLYSVAPPGDQAISTMTRFLTQSQSLFYPSVMGVMKMGNTVTRARLEPTSLAVYYHYTT